MLDERELRGVLGHELSHVYNRDILISSVAAGLASVIMYLGYLAWLVPIGRSSDDDGPGPLGALAVLILGPVAAGLIQMAISRSREYQADASGAQVTGDPLALASALRKLELGTRALPLPPEPSLQTTSALMIANPFRGEGVAKPLLHPPADGRADRPPRADGRLPALGRRARTPRTKTRYDGRPSSRSRCSSRVSTSASSPSLRHWSSSTALAPAR